MNGRMHSLYVFNLAILSDFIWTDIKMKARAASVQLMSVQIKSDKVISATAVVVHLDLHEIYTNASSEYSIYSITEISLWMNDLIILIMNSRFTISILINFLVS